MWRSLRFLGLVFLLAVGLYLRTLAPDVFVSDFAEFQYLPSRLGLAHPNGFPFYMLLGWLWSSLPVGALAWRMNLLSALGGALAVALTAGFILRLTHRRSVALLGAGLLALSPTFWSFSLAAERYTLNLALMAAALWAAWEAGEAQRQGVPPAVGRRLAFLSAVLVSLGLATHPTNALLVPFWLAYLAWRLPQHRRSARFWFGMALASGLPLLCYLYVPWRWAALSGYPGVTGVGGSSAIYQGLAHVWYQPALDPRLLQEYVLGLGGYAGGLLQGGWRQVLVRLADLAAVWRAEIPWPLWPLTALGALRLLRRDAALAGVLGGFSLALSVAVAYIQQGKNDAYLLPAFWSVMFCAALALDLLLGRMARLYAARPRAGRAIHLVVVALVAAALLLLAWQRYPARDLSRRADIGQWWRATLNHPIEPRAALLAHWSDLTPFWYMQQAEGRRTDLLGLFPPDPDAVIGPWLETGRSLYLAGPLHGWAPDLAHQYGLMPWGNLVRVLRWGEAAPCPVLSNPAESPAGWPIVLSGWQVDGPLAGGASGLLSFCWAAQIDLPRQTFVAIELQPAGSRSPIRLNEPLFIQWYPRESLPAGATGLAIIPLRLPLGVMPGVYTLSFTPYRIADDGQAVPLVAQDGGEKPLVLGQVTVAPSQAFARALLTDEVSPIIAPRTRSTSSEGGLLVLRAWRLSPGPVRPGDPIQVNLLWEVIEAPRVPLTLSLTFWDSSGQGRAGPTLAILGAPSAADPLAPGAMLRTSAVAPAPRGRGDRVYMVELRIRAGDKWMTWLPTGRLPIGTIRVLDRQHLDGAPGDATPVDATFGNMTRLVRYTVGSGQDAAGEARQISAGDAPSLAAGESLSVTLYWRVLAETDRSLKVFVHLVDAGGTIVAQHDSPPANGSLPTSTWVKGEVIPDAHGLALPAGLRPGSYTIRIGMYDPATSERLPITSSLPNADRSLELLRIEVTP